MNNTVQQGYREDMVKYKEQIKKYAEICCKKKEL